jgi:hypothetical protein
MTIDPDQIFAAVMAVVFLVAGVDVGVAFLMRVTRESTPDD